MSRAGYSATGPCTCHDAGGGEVPCAGSGQDVEYRAGEPCSNPRFEIQGQLVVDCLTGLLWPHDASVSEFPLTRMEALDHVRRLNAHRWSGHDDWRVPDHREPGSLTSQQSRRPALPGGHPFQNIVSGWYWTSTTAAGAPAHAWYVCMAVERNIQSKGSFRSPLDCPQSAPGAVV